jgi:excisionase family DNA binding protein
MHALLGMAAVSLARELLAVIDAGDVDAISPEALEALAGHLRPYLPKPREEAQDALLTAHEAAQHARAHVETIRRAVRRGELSAAQVGRSLRIRSGDLEAWLASSERDGTEPPPTRPSRSRPRRRPMAEALAQVESVRSSR